MNGRKAIDVDCPTCFASPGNACFLSKKPCQKRIDAAAKLTRRLNAAAKLAFFDKKK